MHMGKAGAEVSGDVASARMLRRFKAEVFSVLSHPTRIHIIECLRDGEIPVGTIISRVGIEPSNASQHLSILRAKGLVVARKEGNQVFYSLKGDFLVEVLDSMRHYFDAHIEDVLVTMRTIQGWSEGKV